MLPYSKERGWNIPAAGKWVGIVVVVSAFLGGAYDFLWVIANARAMDNEAGDRLFLSGLLGAWRYVLTLGASGVVVFLLAEILERITWNGDIEEVESSADGKNRENLS